MTEQPKTKFHISYPRFYFICFGSRHFVVLNLTWCFHSLLDIKCNRKARYYRPLFPRCAVKFGAFCTVPIKRGIQNYRTDILKFSTFKN